MKTLNLFPTGNTASRDHDKVIHIPRSAAKLSSPGVVPCTCNPVTKEPESRNGMGSILVGSKSPSIGGRIV